MSVDDFVKHFQWLTDEKTIKALEKMKKREQKERNKKLKLNLTVEKLGL